MKRIKFFLAFLWLVFLSFSTEQVFAQLTIDDHSYSQIQLIQKLAGKGVKISNIQFNCPNKSGSSPYGYFEDNTGTLGIESGMIMTSGAAVIALGPNDDDGAGQDNENSNKAAELSSLVSEDKILFDACKIEFDITVESNSLVFNFVFGSEEYPEYTRSYHDVFGFYISGPGISGEKNIAVLPNTNTPIDVHTVNDSANTNYYIPNGTGAFPNLNLDLQYDGYTRVLVASANVISCQTYHLKLIIADVLDGILDSGVFLENKSIQSIQSFTSYVLYEHQQFSTAIEGCNKAYVVFKRTIKNNTQPIVVAYTIAGNADMGIDYETFNRSVTIPAGQDSVFLTIDAIADNINDAGENVQLLIKSLCPNLPPQDTVTVVINEEFEYKIPENKICLGDSVVLNKNPDNRYSFLWDQSNDLSCTNCSSPVANPITSAYYKFRVQEIASGCIAHDSASVKILNLPLADFDYSENPFMTSLDIDFKNLSLNSDEFLWSFGDGNFSNEFEPMHHYSPSNTDGENIFEVMLISKWKGFSCNDTIIKKIVVNPLFLPNLITANQDGKNELFAVKGLKSGMWELIIYNRWGGMVYRNPGYDNNWAGENVCAGVYYYLFQSRGKTIHGWVEVIK